MAVTERGPNDFEVVLKYDGGINTRASLPDIEDVESTAGENFDLDLENGEYRNRKPFDLAGTAPNVGSIDGFAQLKKRDGTLTMLVQAGTNVYSWDGAASFVLVGTVATGTKMRGPSASQWDLGEKVLISDLALQNNVMEWDGATLSDVTFTGTTGGVMRARYILIDRERAIYSNLFENSTAFPHMFVGSTISDYTTVSVADRPSSALGAADPWFMLTPDLKAINASVSAFGVIAVSSKDGNTYQITGEDATDFAIVSLFSGSGADGDEPMSYIGNDVAFGRPGRIETLTGTQAFGDVETDDVSRKIADSISDFKGWTVVFNARTQKAFFFADGKSDMYVLHKPLLDEVRRLRSSTLATNGTSPWSKWTTKHAIDFQPTTVMTLTNPIDGLETVFMGDSLGNVYRLEGSGTSGDGGTSTITTSRTSKLFSVPLNAAVFDVEGYVQYLKGDAATLTLTVLWAGTSTTSQTITIALDAITDASHYGGASYYSGGKYYSSPTRGRFVRKIFAPAGQATSFQVKAEVIGTTNVNISEIGLRFQAA